MANLIKDTFGSATALTITLASLASSTAGVGRQSTFVDNTTNRYRDALIMVKIKQGTSPTGSKSVKVYLLRAINSVYEDGAGASDAGITILNAELIGVMSNKASPSTGDVLIKPFLIERLGPSWAIAIVHDTGVNLDSTGGNHSIEYVGLNPEVQ